MKIFNKFHKVKLEEVYQWAIDTGLLEEQSENFKFSIKALKDLHDIKSCIFKNPIDDISWLLTSDLHWKVRDLIVYLVNYYKEEHV